MVANIVLMGFAITAIIALQRADRNQTDRADRRREVSQLVDRLRDDLHVANRLAWNQDDGSLQLTTSADGEVVYSRAGDRWRRVAGEGSSADYPLPPRLRWRVEPAQASPGELVRIQFYAKRQSLGDSQAETIHAELSAVIGRDGRLLAQ
jgi:hypothetical protein